MAKVVICLEIDGTDALAVVDECLENGIPQDLINTHEFEGLGPVHVRSAVVRPADIIPRELHAELFAPEPGEPR